METIVLAHEVDWDGWRTAARRLALSNIPPESVLWSVGQPNDLFAATPAEPAAPPPPGTFSVSRALVTLAETAIQNSDPERFTLLYRLIWRAHAGEKHLLDQPTDPGVHAVNRLAQSVRRDTHKMRAFLRFREVQDEGGTTRHIAWFEPDHYILEANCAFFIRRFATMTWSILTPYRSAHWNGQTLEFAPGATRADIPADDHLEAYWRAYYAAIFNPARLKISAMTSEMPRKYWRNLPEAAVIPDLIQSAQSRTQAMIEAPAVSSPRPHAPKPAPAILAPAPTTLTEAAQDIHECRRCALWQHAMQPVFGEGPAGARIMLIGEQPGDQEDLAGRPFVGPAGQLLDRALEEAGLDRRQLYVTNAVKHFKFIPRGKRRIHEKPGAGEIEACKFWLDLERTTIEPVITVMLGATAARALLGRPVTITRERGRPLALEGNRQGFITVHPSYLLRLPDEESKRREWTAFVHDLKSAAALAA